MIFRLKNRLFTRIFTVLLLISLTVFMAGGSLRVAFAEETAESSAEETFAEETTDSSFDEAETGEEPYSEDEAFAETGEEEPDETDPDDPEQESDGSDETEQAEEDGSETGEEPGAAGETDGESFESDDSEEPSDGTEEDDFFVTDEEYVEEELTEEDPFEEGLEEEEEEEEEEDEEDEEAPQFAGESGTTDFETLPLLDLSIEELQTCSFCTGKDLSRVQMAVILAYMKAGNEALDYTADDGAGILASFGLQKKDYSAWCKKNELKKASLKNQLSYMYSVIFRNAQGTETENRTVSMFRKAGNVKLAASAFYSAARERNIKLPYEKEEITDEIIPMAQDYLDLFMLGGEKREGTAGVAYYCQGNYANVSYDEGTVADSGCGITAFSMVASEITGLNFGPEVTASWAYPNGVNTVTNWGAYWWLAQRFGVEFLGQYSGDFDLAVEALKEGNLVIASIRQDGFFTTSSAGHYILLTGVEEDGRICVNDPASYERSVYGPFEYDAVFGSCLQFWIFGR